METFDKLIELINVLHEPGGCPWDAIQTLKSLRPHLLEETYEFLEAIDQDKMESAVEELGDIFFLILSFAKIFEKNKISDLEKILNMLIEKLTFRHPHVFGDLEARNLQDVTKIWEESKKKEYIERENIFEGIPKTLNALTRTQKMLEKIEQKGFNNIFLPKPNSQNEAIGIELINLVSKAQKAGIDAESVLRKALHDFEVHFLNEKTSDQ